MNSIKRLAAAAFGLAALGVGTISLADDAPSDVTFTRDVAPILYANCVGCHRPGEVAPMSLLTYEEVRPWIKSIRQAVVQDKTMPPWHSSMPKGFFSNDRRLDDKQVATIEAWIKQGAKQGDPKAMPAVPTFKEGWKLGEPDYVIEFKPEDIPAEGEDLFRNLNAQLTTTEDKWVTAIEIQPSARKVVHHVIALTAEAMQQAQQGQGLQGWLGAWAAGADPTAFPEGTGRLLKAGATVLANMHYHPSGEAATNTLRIGLHFAEPNDKLTEIVNLWVMNPTFAIPPNNPNYEVRAEHTFAEDSTIYTVSPHMHYRGKDMKITAFLPDGKEMLLCESPKYDFNWQTGYILKEPIRVPKGTRVEALAHFDNSTNNLANPDPNKEVHFGLQSFDEMMIGFIDYVSEAPKAGEASGG